MGSVKCPTPASTVDLPILEAKVDNLAHTLEQILSKRNGGCPICSTCSLHSSQQGATERQLASQSRLLEKLEKEVDKMQRTLEGLSKGLDGRVLNALQGAAPTMETQPSITSGPSRTPLITGKVEQRIGGNPQEISSPPMARSHRPSEEEGMREVVVAVVVPSTSIIQKTTTITTAVTENKPATDETSNQVETNHVTKQHTLTTPHKKDNRQMKRLSAGPGAMQRDHGGTTAEEQQFGGNPHQVRGPRSESLRRSESEGMGEAVVAVTEAVPSTLVTQKTRTQVTENKPATATSQLAPHKLSGLAVPMVTMQSSSLRHVHSCPDSLQRLQSTGPKPLSVCPVPAPPLEKSCPILAPLLGKKSSVVRGTGPVPASGIQIRLVPATADRTQAKPPPKTSCHNVIDDIPPQAATFLHRFVSLRSNPPSDAFIIHIEEVLGGGRFGTVHRCTEKSSGLRLAAKIIKTRNAKEKEMAINEVQVMNQLSHANILQLYDAFETKNQVVLILEYVEGGELFDRIVDESAPLTEVDAMVFIRQICEGVHYMHQMYVLHLDLKPENILCVNRNGHQVKIIDFGLARRYRPRDKQRVNFGTPEFLAPEVVNFDFVSFPTDMWTLGVVTYMLLSGLSPFLGDDDSQTLNNVLAVNWYFEEEAFEHISAEARDFISNLLIREKGGRLSAAQCLNHPWLNNISEKAKHRNIVLKSQVLLKKYMAKRLWKKNYIAIAAANRFKKISSSGSLTSLGI